MTAISERSKSFSLQTRTYDTLTYSTRKTRARRSLACSPISFHGSAALRWGLRAHSPAIFAHGRVKPHSPPPHRRYILPFHHRRPH